MPHVGRADCGDRGALRGCMRCTGWSIRLLYAACRPDSVTQSCKRAAREVAVCTTISAPVFCHTHYVTEPQTTRVRRGAAWDDMQQTTRDGVDQINVATNSPANFSRWHPALTGAGWTALNCTGLQCTPLGMTAPAGMIANKSRKRQTASAPAHFSVSTPLTLCPLRSSFRYVSSLLLARAGC